MPELGSGSLTWFRADDPADVLFVRHVIARTLPGTTAVVAGEATDDPTQFVATAVKV